jgi:pyrimidine-specific ribonucleoside hydrolase
MSPPPHPVVVDCDPGIDDAVAVLLACASPEIALLAVTTVYGNASLQQTTGNALGVLALAGRADVPVAAGADRPLAGPPPPPSTRHGPNGVGGVSLPERARPADHRHAVDLIAEIVQDAPAPVTLVAIGPLTNVALLYALRPDVAGWLRRVVVLGGSGVRAGADASPETNVRADPDAAHRVLVAPGLDRPVPTVLVGVDVSRAAALRPSGVARLRRGGRIAGTAAAMLDYYATQQVLPDRAVTVPDAVAVAEAIRPGLVRTDAHPLTVDRTNGSRRGVVAVSAGRAGVPIDVAVSADGPALADLITSRLVHSPTAYRPFG